MIKTFKSKALAELWSKGLSAKIDARIQARILRRLDVLDQAKRPEDLNVTGFDFHALKGFQPARYTIHVNGPWCLTFEFEGEDVTRVDFEQYH